MSGANLRLRRVWRVNHLHVPARAPRTAERAHRIEIPTHPPVSSVLGPNERSAQSKSVLWRHTAGGYVQRMVRKQCVRAPRHRLKASVAGISRTLALAPQLSLQRALLRQREDRKSTRLNSSHGYISYAVFCLKKKNSRSMTPPSPNSLSLS